MRGKRLALPLLLLLLFPFSVSGAVALVSRYHQVEYYYLASLRKVKWKLNAVCLVVKNMLQLSKDRPRFRAVKKISP